MWYIIARESKIINQMNAGNVDSFLKDYFFSVPTYIMNSLWFSELLGDHISE